MVIRVPVNLDVTDDDIERTIVTEVRAGATSSRAAAAGSLIGTQLAQGITRSFRSGGLAAQGETIGAQLGEGITRGADGRLRDARGRFIAAGEEAGRGFSVGLGRGLGGISTFGQLEFSAARLGSVFSGLAGLVIPVGPALAGVAAGALAVAGAAGQAAGAAVSAGGVIASLGLASATTQVAMVGLSAAFEAQSKANQELAATGQVSAATQEELTRALEGLAPAAARVVTEVQAITPAWQAMQQVVQQEVFRGIGRELQGLSDAILPAVQAGLVGTAGVLNEAALSFARFAQSEAFVAQLDVILSGLTDTLAALLPGAAAIGAALVDVFAAGVGPALQMAQAISDVGVRFGSWLQGIAATGQLTNFLFGANAILGDLLRIVGNVGSVLGSVFSAGAATGASLITMLADATGQLTAFMQTAGATEGLAQFFGLVGQTTAALSQIGAIAGPIFQGLFVVIGQLLDPINLLRDALLPVAVVLGQTIGTALTALAPVIGLVAQLIVGLVQALAPLVSTIVAGLGPAIAELAASFQGSLAPALGELFTLLEPLLGIFLEIFGAQVVNAVNLVVDVLAGLFDILGGLINFLTGVFTGDWEQAWGGLVQIFDGIVGILGGLVGFLIRTVDNQFKAFFPRLAVLARQGWDRLVTTFRAAVQNHALLVTSLAARVVAGFTSLRARVGATVSALWGNVVRFFTSGGSRIYSSVLSAVSRVIGAFVNLRSRITATVAGFGSLLFNAGRNLIQGLINGIRSLIGSVGSSMSDIAATIRAYLPFSPAKVGPLSGAGSPELSGEAIARMIADGIQQNVNLPSQAMRAALAPLSPQALAAQTPGGMQTGLQRDVGGSGVTVQQIFTGPTTSGGRLQEMTWNIRYATQARREVIGGVPTA